jgi:hypothetical protein
MAVFALIARFLSVRSSSGSQGNVPNHIFGRALRDFAFSLWMAHVSRKWEMSDDISEKLPDFYGQMGIQQ